MKKLLMFAVMAMMSLCASAATITLEDSACTDTRVCTAVANDATPEADILVYASATYGTFGIWINGVQYAGKDPSLQGLAYDQYGHYVTVTFQWRTWTTRGSGSGRGGYASHTHWELLGGSVVMP